MSVSISVVIPARNAACYLPACLEHLGRSWAPPAEAIVVDDGSEDGSIGVARAYQAKVLTTGSRRGPAHARNLGAASAQGDIVWFVDADVCVYPENAGRIKAAFDSDPDLAAVFGSYDDQPAAPNFLSQYKNLMHCFVHQSSRSDAWTFWSGCGAIRKDVFLEFGGFDESHRRPSIEDIALGYRLTQARRKMLLDKRLLCKHLKRWTFAGLLKTDIVDRGIPWTMLILRERHIPDDLNLKWTQRWSVPVVFALIVACALIAVRPWIGAPLTAATVALLIYLNRAFYRFLALKRGHRFTVAAIPCHFLYHFYNGISFLAGTAMFLWKRPPPTTSS